MYINHLSYAAGEAVFARCLSSLKTERVEASRILTGPEAARYEGNRKEMVENIKRVQNAALLISFAFFVHCLTYVCVCA